MRWIAPIIITAAAVGCSESPPIGPEPTSTTSSTTDTNSGGSSPTTTTTQQGGGGTGGSGGSTGGSGGTGGDGGSSGGGGSGGGVSVSAAGYISGSRLRAKYYEAADGSRQFYGWHDSQLGVDCVYLRAVDGLMRCLPWGNQYMVAVYFADSLCTQSIAYSSQPGCPAHSHAFRTSGTCSTVEYQVYPVLSEMQPQPTTIYYSDPPNCDPYDAPAGYTYYNLGPELAPSTFVEGVPMVE